MIQWGRRICWIRHSGFVEEMIVDRILLDNLVVKAKANLRLRMYIDLRNGPDYVSSKDSIGMNTIINTIKSLGLLV